MLASTTCSKYLRHEWIAKTKSKKEMRKKTKYIRARHGDILKVDFDSSNVKGDNKIYNFQGEDDNSLEDDGDIDWGERLWQAARQHYHKAYPDTDNESLVELSQYQVSEFRSCMVTCIVVYARTFHTLSSKRTNPDSYSESVQKG